MEIRRTIAAGTLALAFVSSGIGCGAAADKVAEKATERAVEEAIEGSGDCENVDIDQDGGVSAECNGQDIDVDAGGDAELPESWPGELAPPDEAKLVFASESNGTLTATAGLDGELAAVTDGITGQLEAAGYTIDDETTADAGGFASSSIRATGDAYQAFVAVTEVENAVEGNLTISYTLTPAAS